MSSPKFNIAVVGLGFGAEFIPLWQKHPHTDCYAICQRNEEKLNEVGDYWGVAKRYTDYAELLKDPNVDAVHINSPIPNHGGAVDRRAQGRQARRLHRADGDYGRGLPRDHPAHPGDRAQVHDDGNRRLCPRVPFHERTARQGRARQTPVRPGEPSAGHGWLAELLARPSADVVRHALRRPGARAGRRRRGICELLRQRHRCAKSSSSTTARRLRSRARTSKCAGSDLSARIIRSLFDTARQYREIIDVYGSKKSVEWPLIEHDPLIIHTAKKPEPEIPEKVKCPDFAKRLPEPHPALHHQGRLRLRRKNAPQLRARRRPRRQPPAPGARIRHGPGRKSRAVPERKTERQLDLHGHPFAPKRDGRRRHQAPAKRDAQLGVAFGKSNPQAPPTQP